MSFRPVEVHISVKLLSALDAPALTRSLINFLMVPCSLRTFIWTVVCSPEL